MRRTVLTTSALTALVTHLGWATASAQQAVAVDSTTTQQTVLDYAPNGVPIVHVDSPNDAGVSHNLFTRFGVGREGLILNNASVFAQSILGGPLLANPNLADGRTADLIIVEVTGQDRSELYGLTEIFGDRADLVVANAYGITCDGCGFLNSSRVTFATGDVRLGPDGSLNGFDVSRGDVTITGAGLNASNLDAFDIVSAAAFINADLVAQDLLVSAGTQEFDYAARLGQSRGPAGTGVAIDSSALGGMYANRIRLIGTQRGVGVNLSGVVASLDGDLEIAADGRIVVTQASATEDVALVSAETVTVADRVYAGEALSVEADALVVDEAILASGGDMTAGVGRLEATRGVLAAGIGSEGTLSGDASITVLAEDLVLEASTVAAAGDASMIVDSAEIGSGSRVQATNVAIDAATFDNAGAVTATTRLSVRAEAATTAAQSILRSGSDALLVAETASLDGTIEAVGGLTIGVSDLTASGRVVTGGGLGGFFDTLQLNGVLAAGGTVHLEADRLDVSRDGVLAASGHLSIVGGDAIVNGSVATDSDASFELSRLDLVGTVGVGGSLDASIADVLSSSGSVAVSGTADILAGTVILPGEIVAYQDLVLTADALSVASTGRLLAGGDLDIAAGRIEALGTIGANGAASLIADELELSTDSLLTTGGNLSVASQGGAIMAGRVLAGGEASVSATDLSVAGQLVADRGLQVRVGREADLSGMLATSGDALVTGEVVSLGTIAANGRLDIIAADRLTVNGQVTAIENLSAFATETLDVAETGVLASSADVSMEGSTVAIDGTVSASETLDARATSLGVAGRAVSGEAIAITAELLTLDGGGEVASGGSLAFGGAQIDVDGLLYAAGPATLTVPNLSVGEDGRVVSDGTLVTSARAIENEGLISSGGDLVLDLDRLGGRGLTLATEAISLDFSGDAALSGTVSAGGALTALADGDVAIDEDALLFAGGALAIVGSGALDARGRLIADGNLSFEGAHGHISGALFAGGDTMLGVSGSIDVAGSGVIESLGDLVVSGDVLTLDGRVVSNGTASANALGTMSVTGTLVGVEGVVVAADTLDIAGALASVGDVSLTADRFVSTGLIEADGTVAMVATNATLEGTVRSSTLLDLDASRLTQSGLLAADRVLLSVNDAIFGGTVYAEEALLLDVANSAYVDGELLSDGSLSLDASRLDAATGRIASTGDATLSADILRIGELTAGRSLTLTATERLGTEGSIATSGSLVLNASDGVLAMGGTIETLGSAILRAGELEASGRLLANGELTVEAIDMVLGSGSALVTLGVGVIEADTVEVAGSIEAGEALTLTTRTFEGAGSLLSGGVLDVESSGSFRSSGDVQAVGTVTITSADAFLNVLRSEGGAFVDSRGSVVVGGDVATGGGLTVHADVDATILTEGALSTVGRLDLSAGGAILNQGIVLAEDVEGGASGVLTINSSNELVNAGLLLGRTALNVSTGRAENAAAGEIVTDGLLTMAASQLRNDGLVIADALDADLTSLLGSGVLSTRAAIDLTFGTDAVIDGGLFSAEGVSLSVAEGGLTLADSAAIGSGADLLLTAAGDLILAGIASGEGHLWLTAGGQLDLTGDLVGAGAASDVALTADAIRLGSLGRIETTGRVGITAAADSELSGRIFAGGDVTSSSGELALNGVLATDGRFSASASDISVTGSSLLVGDTQAASVVALGGADLDANALRLSGPLMWVGDLDVTADAFVSDADLTLFSADDEGALADFDLSANTAAFSGGRVSSGRLSILTVGETSMSAASALFAEGPMSVTAGSLTSGGTLTTGGNLDLVGGSLGLDGIIAARGDVVVNANVLSAGGDLVALGQTSIDVAGSAVLTEGAWSSFGDLTLSADTVTASGGELVSGSSLVISGRELDLAGTSRASGDVMVVGADRLALAGSLSSGSSVFAASGNALDVGGQVTAISDVTLVGGDVRIEGIIATSGGLDIAAGSNDTAGVSVGDVQLSLPNVGTLVIGESGILIAGPSTGESARPADQSITIGVAGGATFDGALQAAGRVAIRTDGAVVGVGDITAGTDLDLISASDISLSGPIGASNDVFLAAESLVLADVGARGDLSVRADDALTVLALDGSAGLQSLGETSLTAGSALTLYGDVQSVGDLTVAAGSIELGGTSATGGRASVSSVETTTVSAGGVLSASDLTDLDALTLRIDGAVHGAGVDVLASDVQVGVLGTLTSNTTLDLTASFLDNQGTVSSLGALFVTSGTVDTAGVISSDASITLTGTRRGFDRLDVAAGVVSAGQDLSVAGFGRVESGPAASLIAGNDLSLVAPRILLDGSAYALEGAAYVWANQQLGTDGVVFGQTRVDVVGGSDLVHRGSIQSAGDVSFVLGSLAVDGEVVADGGLTVDVDGAFLQRGTVSAGQDLWVDSAAFTQGLDALTYAGGDAFFDVTSVDNQGTLAALGRLNVMASGDVRNVGTFFGGEALRLVASGRFENTASGVVEAAPSAPGEDLFAGAASDLFVSAEGGIVNAGRLFSAGSAHLTGGAVGTIVNAGEIFAGTSLSLDADAGVASRDGTITSLDLGIRQSGSFENTDGLTVFRDLTIEADSFANDALLGAGRHLVLVSAGDVSNSATIFAGGNLSVRTDGDVSNTGIIIGEGNVRLVGENGTGPMGTLRNSSGRIESVAANILIEADSVINEVAELGFGVDTGNGSDPAYRREYATENSGTSVIASAGDVLIDAVGLVRNDHSSILAGGDIAIRAARLENLATELIFTRTESTPSTTPIDPSDPEYCLQYSEARGCTEPNFPDDCIFLGSQCFLPIDRVITTRSSVPSIIRANGTVSLNAGQVVNGGEVLDGGAGPDASMTPTAGPLEEQGARTVATGSSAAASAVLEIVSVDALRVAPVLASPSVQAGAVVAPETRGQGGVVTNALAEGSALTGDAARPQGSGSDVLTRPDEVGGGTVTTVVVDPSSDEPPVLTGDPLSGEPDGAEVGTVVGAGSGNGDTPQAEAAAGLGELSDAIAATFYGGSDVLSAAARPGRALDTLGGFLEGFGLGADGSAIQIGGTLFTRDASQDAAYLFVSDPTLSGLADFYESDFFWDRTVGDRDTHFTRLGDGYFEAQFVNRQVQDLTDRALLSGYGSAADQFEGLLRSAADQAEGLGLTLGVALTDEQVAALTDSLVWYVEAEVAGQTVLVPVVYLAAADASGTATNGALVAGGNVAISGGDLTNSGLIYGETVTRIDLDGTLTNFGGLHGGEALVATAARDIVLDQSVVTGGLMSLQAGGDLSVIAGDIAAAGDALLTAGGALDIASVATTVTERHDQTGRRRYWSHGVETRTTQETASVEAGGDLVLSSMDDLTVEGAELMAGGTLSLLTERGDISVTTAIESWDSTERGREGRWRHEIETGGVTNIQSVLTAGTNVSVVSGGDLLLAGALLGADGDVSLLAEGDTLITAVQDESVLDVHEWKRGWNDKDYFYVEDITTNIATVIEAGGDVLINTVLAEDGQRLSVASGDVDIAGAVVLAENDLLAYAGGDLSVASTEERTAILDEYVRDSVFSGERRRDEWDVTTRSGGYVEAGGDASLIAGRDIAVEAGIVASQTGDVLLAAGTDGAGSVLITGGEESQSYDGLDEASGWSFGGSAQSGSASTTFGYSDVSAEQSTSQTTNLSSYVVADAGSVTITAADDVTVTGSVVTAAQDLGIAAGGSVTIDAATESFEGTSRYEETRLGITTTVSEGVTRAIDSLATLDDRATVGEGGAVQEGVTAASEALRTYGDVAGAINGTVSASTTIGMSSASETSSETRTTASSSSLTAGGDLTITAGDDLSVIGSVIASSGDAALIAGRDLSIVSAQSTFSEQSEGDAFGISVGVTASAGLSQAQGADVSVSINGSAYASEYEAGASGVTQTNSVVQADGALLLASGGNTSVSGATIRGTDLALEVGDDLTVETVQDTLVATNDASGVNVGVSYDLVSQTWGGTVGVNGADGATDSQVVGTQTSLTGETVSVSVGGHTQLDGAIIAATDDAGADTGALTLITGTLSVTDVFDTATSHQTQGGVSVAFGEDAEGGLEATNATVDGSHASTSFAQINAGTIGSGEVTVRASDGTELDGVNRDVGAAQVVTEDEASFVGVYVDVATIQDIARDFDGDSATQSSLTAAVDQIGTWIADLGYAAAFSEFQNHIEGLESRLASEELSASERAILLQELEFYNALNDLATGPSDLARIINLVIDGDGPEAEALRSLLEASILTVALEDPRYRDEDGDLTEDALLLLVSLGVDVEAGLVTTFADDGTRRGVRLATEVLRDRALALTERAVAALNEIAPDQAMQLGIAYGAVETIAGDLATLLDLTRDIAGTALYVATGDERFAQSQTDLVALADGLKEFIDVLIDDPMAVGEAIYRDFETKLAEAERLKAEGKHAEAGRIYGEYAAVVLETVLTGGVVGVGAKLTATAAKVDVLLDAAGVVRRGPDIDLGALERRLDALYEKAHDAKEEIDRVADDIAEGIEGAHVAKAPLKSRERAREKAIEDYNGDADRVSDIARNTIVVDSNNVDQVVNQLEARGAKVKIIDGEADELGYQGVIAKVETESGITAEIQIATPEMVFAKEPESVARQILGDRQYDQIASQSSVPGGRGHELYERWRRLDPTSVEARSIAAESREYYRTVRDRAAGGSSTQVERVSGGEGGPTPWVGRQSSTDDVATTNPPTGYSSWGHYIDENKATTDITARVDENGRIDPNDINFTQDTISGSGDGYTVDGNASQLASDDGFDLPPIRVFEVQGQLYTLDNRRLEAYRRAGKPIRVVAATAAEVRADRFKFSTQNGGSSITVRG